jgi:D-Tyr-tRNAtyr deacylase
MNADRRTTIPTVDPMTLRVMDFRDEELRLAQFAYSQTVRSGDKPSFRYVETTHQERQ